MKISIIIPNYNGLNLLKKNLPSVIKSGFDGEIIVVDDASTDGSAEFVKNNFPSIKVIPKIINEGFSSTVNLGVKHASCDLLLLLNHDVSPHAKFAEYLLPHFSDPSVFAVGCLEESYEKGSIVFRGRGIGDFRRGFLMHERGEIDKNTTLWVSGGAGMFRRKIWEELGGLQ